MTVANDSVMTLLSKDLGDYFTSTTTGAGSAGGTTIVDAALMAKANDWINLESWVRFTSGTNDGLERKITSLDNTTGTLTILAATYQVASSVTYEVHRLATASEKRTALQMACKYGFPDIYENVWDESHVSGNWLVDGSFEKWTTTTNPTFWTDTTSTVTQMSTSPYYKHGRYSARIATAAGTLSQDVTNYDDLKYLAGKTVVFTLQGKCDTASCLRISINDGVTQTYSSYHPGDSAWTDDAPATGELYVSQKLGDNPTQITFTIHHEKAAATSYVDDARAISGPRAKIYIGDLDLAQDIPSEVTIEPSNYSQVEPWNPVRKYTVDPNGFLVMPTATPSNLRMRIRGRKYLDFTVSGVPSDAWTASVNLDYPQTSILSAHAARQLCLTKSMPNDTIGSRGEYQRLIAYWDNEIAIRTRRFAMPQPPITSVWSI